MPATLSLPLLDRVSVASPCSMRWDDMSGDERTRHCGACNQKVYNLAGMTREEAEALVRLKEGDPGRRVCVRLYRRGDGTVLTRNCPVGLRRVRHALARWVGSIAACAVLGVGAMAAMGERLRGRSVRIADTEPYVSLTRLLRTPPTVVPAPNRRGLIMGEICIAPPTPTRAQQAPAPGAPPVTTDPAASGSLAHR